MVRFSNDQSFQEEVVLGGILGDGRCIENHFFIYYTMTRPTRAYAFIATPIWIGQSGPACDAGRRISRVTGRAADSTNLTRATNLDVDKPKQNGDLLDHLYKAPKPNKQHTYTKWENGVEGQRH